CRAFADTRTNKSLPKKNATPARRSPRPRGGRPERVRCSQPYFPGAGAGDSEALTRRKRGTDFFTLSYTPHPSGSETTSQAKPRSNGDVLFSGLLIFGSWSNTLLLSLVSLQLRVDRSLGVAALLDRRTSRLHIRPASKRLAIRYIVKLYASAGGVPCSFL